MLQFPDGDTYYALRLRYFSDGLYVESATAKNGALVGAKLIGVNRASSAQLFQMMGELIPHDPGNYGLVRRLGPALIASSNVLHGLGVTKTNTEATFHFSQKGSTVDVTLRPEVPVTDLFGFAPIQGWASARKGGRMPLWLQNNDRNWASYIAASNVEYVQFNSVRDGSDSTLKDFFTSVFASVDRNHPDKLILDMRLNNGGDNALLAPILTGIHQRKRINHRPHLFVIIGPTTYSAAQNFVNRLQLTAQPIFVGEPTGENVNFYGDPDIFQLPNSHIQFGMATRYWQDMPASDVRIATAPDIHAVMSIDDYIAGRDPALDAIMRFRPQ